MALAEGWKRFRRLLCRAEWSYELGLRSRESLRLPHFLGIGAQKAGTTWLDENLRCHPELFLPASKEIHYFDRRWRRSVRWYEEHFAGSGDRVRGEITPGYATLPRARIRRVRELMPDVRLILLMRDPVSRAWSHAVMHLCARTGRAVEDVPDDEFLRHFESPESRARGDYLRIVSRWLEQYPPEQLFLGYYEDLTLRPEELLRAVFAHIGVAQEADWDRMPLRRVFHAGPPAPMPERFRERLREIYAGDLQRMRRRFGARVEAWGGSHAAASRP